MVFSNPINIATATMEQIYDRLLATSDEARAGWYIADYSAFRFRAQVTE